MKTPLCVGAAVDVRAREARADHVFPALRAGRHGSRAEAKAGSAHLQARSPGSRLHHPNPSHKLPSLQLPSPAPARAPPPCSAGQTRSPPRCLSRSPDQIRLFHMPNETLLEDAWTLADHKIETDAILAIVFRLPGAAALILCFVRGRCWLSHACQRLGRCRRRLLRLTCRVPRPVADSDDFAPIAIAAVAHSLTSH